MSLNTDNEIKANLKYKDIKKTCIYEGTEGKGVKRCGDAMPGDLPINRSINHSVTNQARHW